VLTFRYVITDEPNRTGNDVSGRGQYRVSSQLSRLPAKAQLTDMNAGGTELNATTSAAGLNSKTKFVGKSGKRKAESRKSPRRKSRMENGRSTAAVWVGESGFWGGWVVRWPCSLALPNCRRCRTEVRAFLQFYWRFIPMKD